MYVCMYVCMYVYVWYVCKYTYICVCVCVCVCVYMYVCIYVLPFFHIMIELYNQHICEYHQFYSELYIFYLVYNQALFFIFLYYYLSFCL